MSISLLISQDGSIDKTRAVPITTETLFSEFWQPAASELNLHFVPLFQSGIPVRKDDIVIIVEELQRLRLYFVQQEHSEHKVDILEHIITRIDLLVRELQQAVYQGGGEIYIG